MRTAVIASVLVVLCVAVSVTPASATSIASTHCGEFPANNWWHADISELPVAKNSAKWISHMSTDRDLHPDFGDQYGIPITVVTNKHAKVKVTFDYADESDRVKYPLGSDTRVEGGRNSGGDMHTVVINKDTCTLYETWYTQTAGKKWTAGAGAVWSLKSNKLRPNGFTSADAAGLPILPGLLRYNEVASGTIDHAIRFTTDVTAEAHLWPARHDAGLTSSSAYPPMGARFRLSADFNTAGLSKETKAVVAAMQTYGLVLADNGSPWFFQGEKNSHWPDRLIEELKTIPADAFVAVDTSSLRISSNSAAVK